MCQWPSLVQLNRNITPISAGTPTFQLSMFLLLTPMLYHPGGDQAQSIGHFLLLEYPLQCVSPLEATDALTIIIAGAIQLVPLLPNLLLESFQCVHRPMELCHLGTEGLVPNAFEGVINFVTPHIVAYEVAALFVGVIRRVAIIEVRGGVNIT